MEVAMEAKAIIMAVGSTSDFWTVNETNIPINPSAVIKTPALVCALGDARIFV
jgi:hypothetical protein